MAHALANIWFEIVLMVGLATSVGMIWANWPRIRSALKGDHRQPPRSSL